MGLFDSFNPINTIAPGLGLGDLFGGNTKGSQKSSSASNTQTGSKTGSQSIQDAYQKALQQTQQQQQQQYVLPQATPLQAYGENALYNYLAGNNPYAQLAGQTNTLMNQLLGSGLNATPQQQALLQGQFDTYMQGLQDQLDQAYDRNMSKVQASMISRNIPLSSMSRGAESNVGAQYLKSLAEGYNNAKQYQLGQQLQLPMQNLQLMSGLNQQYNTPLMNALMTVGMNRLQGPRDVSGITTGTTTGTTTGKQTTDQTGWQEGTSSTQSTGKQIANAGLYDWLGLLGNLGSQAASAAGGGGFMFT